MEHGSVSGGGAPADTVDVVVAVNQVFPLYKLCVVHPAVLILPSLFHTKEKEHTERKANFYSGPLGKGNTQQEGSQPLRASISNIFDWNSN